MSDLKPRGVPITLEGLGERYLLFDLNAIEELEDKYDKALWEILTDLTNAGVGSRMLRNIVTILLNAEKERAELLYDNKDVSAVSERKVGCAIGMDNYGEILQAALKAYGISMPNPEDGESPNAKSGRRKG